MLRILLSIPLYSKRENKSFNFLCSLWYLNSNLYKKLIMPSLNPYTGQPNPEPSMFLISSILLTY